MDLPEYRLEKPHLSEDQMVKVMRTFQFNEDFQRLFKTYNTPQYLYWTDVKHKHFGDLSSSQTWFLVRRLRNFNLDATPIKAETGDYFGWMRLPYTDKYLNKIDMLAGGSIFSKKSAPLEKDRLIIRSIMEEAIASSQLEGAHTTRAVAKKMLLEKRAPKNESEQMIVNNYRVMMTIEEEYRHSTLSMDLIFDLHAKLSEGTSAASGKGRLRRDTDDIVVEGPIGEQRYITHTPPKNAFLEKEVKNLIDFANDTDEENFVHPVIKAIFIHFWIGYLHPFTDGNGRLARALFYWYLLKKGYWTMVYLPISTVIKKAWAQYAMAYIRTEQDNFDLTYFYDFHIRKIIQSLNEFEIYIERKSKERNRLDKVLEEDIILNERQSGLLHYLVSDSRANSTASSHSEINNISRQTAAKDLKELEDKELLISRREGKNIRYYASEKLKGLTL